MSVDSVVSVVDRYRKLPFPPFLCRRERERRTWSRINRYRFRLFEPVASVSIPRFCTLRARSRPGNEKCHLSLRAAAAAFLARASEGSLSALA